MWLFAADARGVLCCAAERNMLETGKCRETGYGPRQLKREFERMNDIFNSPSAPAKGTLKIFFGYVAGVGKTYAMLKAAHAAKEQGVDVVAGYVEEHPRPETEALLAGLEQLPHLRVSYKNITLDELDMDAALARRPEVILVDELAHTNAEGCYNRKRYQDVEELLRMGISVWTTVNVQHLESLNDLVASMTGVAVRERVPDSIFDQAEQVELVDLEPEEIIDRLKEGKIYEKAQAERALKHFFLPGNLVALRELALRRMADRVNRIACSEMPGCEQRLQIKEHILICLSGSPSNARVIRTAARMVEAFRGDFTALFVQRSGEPHTDARAEKTLRENIRLAEELGATVVVVQGDDVPAQIAEYGRMSGVSKIVVGRSPSVRGFFRRKPTLVEKLAELAPDMETYIIPDSEPIRPRKLHAAARGGSLKLLMGDPPTLWKHWGITALILALCSAGCWLLRAGGMHDASLVGLYTLGVLGIAAFTAGPWYGIAASGLSVLLFDLLFVEPYFSLSVYDVDYLIILAIMFVVALLASFLTTSARTQAQQSAAKALHMEFILGNSRRLQKAETEDGILDEAARQFSMLLGSDIVYYPVRHGQLGDARFCLAKKEAGQHGSDALLCKNEERLVAQWVMKNGHPAGAGTDTLSGSRCCYIPIRNANTIFAVIGIAGRSEDGDAPVADAAEKNLILTLAGDCALAIEKERLLRANAANRAKAQQEKLRADVLRSISHDLRTPLTSICGSAAMLTGGITRPDEAQQRALAESIEEDARYLVDMVENILALTRLEQYGFTLHLEAELLEDVVCEALNIIRRRAKGRILETEFSEPLLMAHMDARLIVQVLVNLLDNAIKHTSLESAIKIKVFSNEEFAIVEVADEGVGVSDENKLHIFDMFYTASLKKGDGRRGMGVGLALCRSILRAHGGDISVRDNTPRGAIFSFNLQREAGPIALHDALQE